MRITSPAVPNIPLATVSYEQRYTDQTNNVFRLYFNQLSSALRTLFGTNGAAYLDSPCASYYTTTTQTAAAINTAYPIVMDPPVIEKGIFLGTPASRVYVENEIGRAHV